MRQGAGEGQQRRLGGGVVMVGHDRVLDQVGAYVDDAPAAGGAHARQDGLRRVQRGAHAAFDLRVHLGPVQRVGMGARIAIELESGQGVVDDRADGLAEVLAGLRDHGGDGGRVAHVGLQRQRAAGRGGGQGLRAVGAVQVVDDDLGAFAQEGLRDSGAQAAAGAGDDDELLVQVR
ncbi:hypothetical protein D9M68_773780 [compost metagenome]